MHRQPNIIQSIQDKLKTQNTKKKFSKMQKNYKALQHSVLQIRLKPQKNCQNKSTQKVVFFKDRDKVCICLVDKGRPNVFFINNMF